MLGRPFNEVRNYLRGPKDTKIRLTVERAATGKRETVEIIRGAVPQPSIAEAYMIRPGVGYLSMRGGFTRKTYDEFYKDMNELKAEPSPKAGEQQIDVPLAALPPGEYVVEIKAGDKDGEASELLGFRVTG